MYPVSQAYKDAIQQPARQFRGRILIPKLTMSFARNSIAYKQDGTQVAANQPRFEPGKFGKAIMVEEGTTNLLANPSFETDSNSDGLADNWTVMVRGTGDSSRTHAVSRVQALLHGSYAQRLEITGGVTNTNGSGLQSASVNVTPGQVYTASAYVRASVADKVMMSLRWVDSTGAYITDTYSQQKVGTSVTRITVTGTAPANAARVSVVIYGINQVGEWLEVDAVQLEQKPYATSFTDGTRVPETLTIPTAGVLKPQEGTVECWVYVNDVVRRNIASNWPTVVLIRKGSSVANWIWLEHNPAGIWVLQIRKEDGTITGSGSFSDSLTPDGWHYFAIRWNTQEGLAELFHNGVKRISLANVIFPAEYDRINIGHRSGASGDWFNSLIDDLRISSRAKSDEEILAAYMEVA